MSWQKSLVKSLRELRFVISPTNKGTSGAYQFVTSAIPDIHKVSADFPVIVRECEGIDDFVLFRYDYGIEKRVNINGLNAAEIEKIVEEHVKNAKKINSTLQ